MDILKSAGIVLGGKFYSCDALTKALKDVPGEVIPNADPNGQTFSMTVPTPKGILCASPSASQIDITCYTTDIGRAYVVPYPTAAVCGCDPNTDPNMPPVNGVFVDIFGDGDYARTEPNRTVLADSATFTAPTDKTLSAEASVLLF